MILIPVKNLSSAKQRLAAVLDQPSRTALAQAMLHDVFAALHDWKNRPQVAVVTSDPFAVKLAEEYEFEIIPDPDNPGETGAIEMATRICVERGVDSTLVIPADIPTTESGEYRLGLLACCRRRARRRCGWPSRWRRFLRDCRGRG